MICFVNRESQNQTGGTLGRSVSRLQESVLDEVDETETGSPVRARSRMSFRGRDNGEQGFRLSNSMNDLSDIGRKSSQWKRNLEADLYFEVCGYSTQKHSCSVVYYSKNSDITWFGIYQ